jgi:hypothetical protein
MARVSAARIRLACVALVAFLAPGFASSDAKAEDEFQMASCESIVPPCSWTSSHQCKPHSACTDGFGDIQIVYRS